MVTTEQCFWAGKQDPDNQVFVGYEPCEEVAVLWTDNRIVVMECRESPIFAGQPPFKSEQAEYFPTGRWLAVNRSSEMFNHVPHKQAIMDEGRMLVDTELFDMIAGASAK